MFFSEVFDGSFWWIFPLLMMILCFLMIKGRMGSMCGFGTPREERRQITSSDSAMDVLDKRYALGEINKDEYEEKKRILTERS